MSKSFGIISGAGPMAGALFYRRVIELLQATGAWRDSEFPSIVMLNVPFSDMLGDQKNDNIVRQELLMALDNLSLQVDYIYIACQTLHAFLSQEEMRGFRVISLLDLLSYQVASINKPIMIAASNTARRYNLHAEISKSALIQYFKPEESDIAIEKTLRGLQPDLSWLIEQSFRNVIILGCTEFSVCCDGMRFNWIDPIQLAAIDLVDRFIN